MHVEIGVTPDRRGEVAVVVAGEGVVLVLDRRVGRLLEAPQQGVMDRGPLRLVGRFVEHPLQLEPVLRPADRVAEQPGEGGERGQLLLVRGRVDAAEEDRKSTRLNSSHQIISYAVFCLKKKKIKTQSPSMLVSSPLMCVRTVVK